MRTGSFTSREVCNNHVLEEENVSLPSDAISEAGSISSTMSLERRRAAAIARKRGLEQKYEFMKKKLQRETEMKLKIMEVEFQIEENDIDTELKAIEALEGGTGSAETSLPAGSHNACSICKANHEAIDCRYLLEKSPEERFKLVHRSRLCLNCLMGGHIAKECKADIRCKVTSCGRRHCTILHQEGWKNKNVKSQSQEGKSKLMTQNKENKGDVTQTHEKSEAKEKDASKSCKPPFDQKAEKEKVSIASGSDAEKCEESKEQNTNGTKDTNDAGKDETHKNESVLHIERKKETCTEGETKILTEENGTHEDGQHAHEEESQIHHHNDIEGTIKSASPVLEVKAKTEAEVVTQDNIKDTDGNDYDIYDTTRFKRPVIAVKVKAPGSKRYVSTFAALDGRYRRSLCSDQLLKELGVKGRNVLASTFAGEEWRTIASMEVNNLNGMEKLNLPVVLASENLPAHKYDVASKDDLTGWQHLRGVNIATPSAEEVKLIIGSDAPEALIPKSDIKERMNGPWATKTLLGWTVNGIVKSWEETMAYVWKS